MQAIVICLWGISKRYFQAKKARYKKVYNIIIFFKKMNNNNGNPICGGKYGKMYSRC